MSSSQQSTHAEQKQEDAVLVGTLVRKPWGQLLLNGMPCTVEVPEALSELGSCLAGLQDDGVLELISDRHRMCNMWFGRRTVMLALSKKNHYIVVDACRTYLLWRALWPYLRNPLSVLILPPLTSKEIADHIAFEGFGVPLLDLLFGLQEKNESPASNMRKGHRGNLMRTLNNAADNIRILNQSIREFLGLSTADLECFGLEHYYYRSHRRSGGGQEQAATTSSMAESGQGDKHDNELSPGGTQGSDSIPEEKFEATVPAGPSDMNDPARISNQDNELQVGDGPDRTHICDTTKPEESATSTITDPAATASAPAESEPAPPAPQESHTPVDPPAVYPPSEPDPNQNEQLPG